MDVWPKKWGELSGGNRTGEMKWDERRKEEEGYWRYLDADGIGEAVEWQRHKRALEENGAKAKKGNWPIGGIGGRRRNKHPHTIWSCRFGFLFVGQMANGLHPTQPFWGVYDGVRKE
jgi:hypothetical protein